MKVAFFLGNVGRGGGGPEVYEMNLLRSLAAIDSTTDYHVLCVDSRGPEVCAVRQENIHYHVLRPALRAVSMLTTLPAMLQWLRPDVVHATFVPPPFPVRNLVYTLPCTSPFAKPEFFPPGIRLRLQYLCKSGIRRASNILCISNHVREYLREHFHIAEERLAMAPLAANESFRPVAAETLTEALSKKHGITKPYFLFSGRWEQRKNILRIIEAFAQFKRRGSSPHQLVFTGQRTWALQESEKLIAKLGIQHDVVDLGKSPLQDLPLLYAGAEALVYPSLWESFGLPILEAMNCGTPVITSQVAAMPEIVGDAGLLVDPYSTAEIAQAMDRISSDRSLRQNLSNAGLRRAQDFGWEKTARQSLAVYENIATPPNAGFIQSTIVPPQAE